MRVISRKGSGFFPGCISTTNPTDSYFYPIRLSLVTAMKWYWRIKEMQIHYVGTSSGGVPFDLTQVSTPGGSGFPEQPFEQEIPCSTSRRWNWNISSTQSLLYATSAGGAGNPAVFFDDPDYLPFISFAGGGNDVTTNPFESGVFVGTLEIDGEDPIDLYARNGLNHPTGVTMTIDAYSYYPYEDSNDENPIYNEVTGAQILDPFSYQDPTA